VTVSTRAKLIVALVVVVAIIGVLIQTAITKASTYYITVDELFAEGASAVDQQTAVSGDIVGSSVDWSPEKSLLKFTIKDSAGSRALPVVFHGDKPDDFANDWPVIVFGKLNNQGVFVADKLLIKCPSKYSSGEQTYQTK
jgi:cytochrome c-type biogenesis protein CcmE